MNTSSMLKRGSSLPRPASSLSSRLQRAAIIFSWPLLYLFVSVWQLSGPPLWWDEGWTLTVARTWVERGHYGRLLNGEFAPNGLEAAFPTTASVALSFKMLGVGIWQGRVPGVLYALAALILLFVLASRLYNRRVAVGAMVVLLLMSIQRDLHPLTIGRQVLAETPMLFFLLSGYLAFLAALRRSPWFLVLSSVTWGIALITKAQVFPFWAVSLLIPLCILTLSRRWAFAAKLGLALFGALAVRRVLPLGINVVLEGHSLMATMVTGLYDVTAFVPVARNRFLALQILLIAGLPAVLGLCYAAWQAVWNERLRLRTAEDVVRLSLLMLAGSWCAWYAFFSLGVPRYLFPVTFIASIFASKFLYDLTDQFSLSKTLNTMLHALHPRHFGFRSAGAWLATLLVLLLVPLTLQMLYGSYLRNIDTSAVQAAEYLNTATASDALIESYDAELFFLLDRKYHYPPDEYHVDLLRRAVTGETRKSGYDPLFADPDYLVVTTAADRWQPYDSELLRTSFRQIQLFGEYAVYERVR